MSGQIDNCFAQQSRAVSQNDCRKLVWYHGFSGENQNSFLGSKIKIQAIILLPDLLVNINIAAVLLSNPVCIRYY